MMKLKYTAYGLALVALLSLPAAAGEKEVRLNKGNAFKASFTEAIANAKEGNIYAVSLGDITAGMLKIKVTNKSTSFYPYLMIVDKDKKELVNASAPAEGGNISDFQLRVGSGRQYFLVVKDYNETIVTEPYTVDIQVMPVPNKYAPNNDFSAAKPIKLGEEIQVTVFAPVEETYDNYFTFSLAKDSTLAVAIPAVPQMTPYIAIYNQHKEEVYNTAANEGADLHGETALPGGTYYIKVKDYNDGSSVQPFRLKIWTK